MKVNTIRSAVNAIKSRAAVLKIYGSLTPSDADAFIRDAEQILTELD
ncbi:MAG: hypothetical protein OK457_11780 [Thaumarchaeota archaeon]|nr:hypothetical protein [Nitrososphaerota archaeon]